MTRNMLAEIVERYPREYTLKNGVRLRKVMAWVQGPDYDWLIDRIRALEVLAERGRIWEMQADDCCWFAHGVEDENKALRTQAARDAEAVGAVRKLGEALAHLNDGHYSLSDATKEVEDAEKMLIDVSERVYYAALADAGKGE